MLVVCVCIYSSSATFPGGLRAGVGDALRSRRCENVSALLVENCWETEGA